MKKLIQKILNKIKNIPNDIKQKGLRKWLLGVLKYLIAFVISCIIVYSPAWITWLCGFIIGSKSVMASGYAIGVGIFTPLIPIGWTVWILPPILIKLWNNKFKNKAL